MEEGLIFTADNFSVVIQVFELGFEKVFVGKIFTNCEQKVYSEKELLVLTGKLRSDLPTFGSIINFNGLKAKEIEFVSFKEKEIRLKNKEILSLTDFNEDEIEFEFFNEPRFMNELKRFNAELDNFIKLAKVD